MHFNQTEKEVLECLASGYSKSDIVDELDISLKTLAKAMTNIRGYLNFQSKGEKAHQMLCHKAAMMFTLRDTYELVVD